jgi:hypothetical protein
MHAQEVRGRTPAAATPARAGEVPFHELMGREVKKLEERLAAYTGAGQCIVVGSGTEHY